MQPDDPLHQAIALEIAPATEATSAPALLRIHPVPHPNAQVGQVGFPLDDPYVEQVWAGVIGPSALLMLRRMPVLWHEQGQPATVALDELGGALCPGPHNPQRTADRHMIFGTT